MPKKVKKKRSINIPIQLRHTCPACEFRYWHYIPYGDEALEKSKEHMVYQVLESKITGTERERSIVELNTYWACCGLAAELLSDHNKILSKQDVDFDVKMRVAKDNPSMIKRFKMIDGIVYIEPISISLANMKRLESRKYFPKAFPIMAGMVDMDEEKLVAEAKSRMTRHT